MINFLSGLPRSGSSLLSSLLRQHPSLHVSATSDLLEALVQLRNNWMQWDGFRSQDHEETKSRIRNTMFGMLKYFYFNEIDSGKIPIDKCRGWPAYIELFEDITGEKAKIICPVRSAADICSSFERIRHSNPITYPHGVGDAYVQAQSVEGRVEALLSEGGVVGLPIRRMTDAISRGLGDRLLIVPHRLIIEDPINTCMSIFNFIGVKPILVYTSSILPDNHKNDLATWGADLHNIGSDIDRNRLSAKSLPRRLEESISDRFPILNSMALNDSITLGSDWSCMLMGE